MKNLLKLSFAAFTITLAFTSCTKHHSENSTTQYFTMTSGAIDSFSAIGTMISVGGAVGAKIEITATSTSGATVYLWITPYHGATGTYSLSTPNGIEYTTTGTIISSTHGTLDLTSVSPHIIGTYTCTGTDSAIFTGTVDVIAP